MKMAKQNHNEIKLTVTDGKSCGIRIDKYLHDSLADETESLTRNAIAILIENEHCTVNGKAVRKSYKTCLNDEILLFIPEPVETGIYAEDIPLDVIYEDNDLLIINKPRGMVVHPSHGHADKTLVNALMFHCRDSLSGINGEIRPGIVHRIDKDTSGLLLVAKNDLIHANLATQIKEHSVTRQYEAVVSGNVRENGTVDAPIMRHKTDRKKMWVSDNPNARNAVTHYEVIRNYKNAAHLKLTLETGRTHQIRVHMAYIGHSVLGDAVYGNGKPKWLEGQCLHAKKLGFIHPVTRNHMEFESKLPDYFKKILGELEKDL